MTEPDADDPYTAAPLRRPGPTWPQGPEGTAPPPYGVPHGHGPGPGGPGAPPPYGYPAPSYGYTAYPPMPVPRTNGKATASMVLALVGVVLWPATLVLGPLAVIFGHIARKEMPLRGETGNGQAVAGLIIGYLFIAFWVLLIFGLVLAGILGSR